MARCFRLIAPAVADWWDLDRPDPGTGQPFFTEGLPRLEAGRKDMKFSSVFHQTFGNFRETLGSFRKPSGSFDEKLMKTYA